MMKDLMNRIRDLEDWQKHMVIWFLLRETNVQGFKEIENVVKHYEQTNYEIRKQLGMKEDYTCNIQ